MKICVCGLGKVGKPLLDTLRDFGHECIGFDVNPALTEASGDVAVQRSESVIVIVPTPSLESGAFDNQFVRGALHRFSACARGQGKSDYLYVVASTVTPGSCDEFRDIVGDNICYKPELIRLEHVYDDLKCPAFHLIGSTKPENALRCASIYFQPKHAAPFKMLSLIEAELAKITINCALTMKISLANQVHLVTRKLTDRDGYKVDAAAIMDAVGADPRIGRSYLKPGAPYGGPCLPRDNKMFQFVAKQVGVDAALSAAADAINEVLNER